MRRVLLAGVAVTALFATGPATGAPVSAGHSAGDSAGRACQDAVSTSARVMEGAAAADHNSVSPEQAEAMNRALQARLREMSPAEQEAARRGAAPVRVDVFWHVLTRNDGSGGVSGPRIKRQLRVLNQGYAGETARSAASTRFSFRTKRIVRTANTDWYNWSDPDVDPSDDRAAKRALHRGNKADLNVYVANLRDDLLGYATFPGGPLALDGVVILNASLPGGAAAPYNQGDTLTHEVGHWLELYHTFQGGCRKPGDYVSDTPQQRAGPNIYKCDTTLDTCAASGRDPVRNFMNYAADACMNAFTRGQATRASQVWDAYRAP
jgi:hypothetical protein